MEMQRLIDKDHSPGACKGDNDILSRLVQVKHSDDSVPLTNLSKGR